MSFKTTNLRSLSVLLFYFTMSLDVNALACPLRTVPAIKLVFNLNWAHKEASHAKKTLQT